MIDTVLAWLNIWWPLMALPGAFVVGCGMGWLFGREDRLLEKATASRWEEAYGNLSARSAKAAERSYELAAAVEVYRRDWQALRAIVEQHTVQQEKA